MNLSDTLKSVQAKEVAWKRRPEVLLHPQIPKPLHGLAPRVVLGKAWWDQERKAAYASTMFHCIACGVHKKMTPRGWLEGHEIYDIDYAKGIATYIETVPLCSTCHAYIHQGRLQMLLDSGQLNKTEYKRIINHGKVVLRSAGIKAKEFKPYEGPMADWGKWFLVINGTKYPALHKCLKDWIAYHRKKDKGSEE
jgi:hypothetical protein